MDALLAATRGLLAGETAHPVLGAEIAELLARIDGCGARSPVSPRMRPAVSRWLAEASVGADPAATALCQALAAASPYLDWYSPYDPASTARELAGFLDGYACALLAGDPRPHGARAPFPSGDVLLAFTLQAPGLHYPPHAHPARELYRVLAGTGEWWRDGEPWTSQPPGRWIVHEHLQSHAMRSHGQPLLAIAAWMDGLDGVAAFTDHRPGCT